MIGKSGGNRWRAWLLAFHFQASVCPAEIVVAEKQSQGRFMVRGVAPELVPVGAAREVNDRVS
jgi:hypothetical protein